MSWISVDIEADGPIPGDYSMISLGAVIVEPGLRRTFYGELKPVSDKWAPEALVVSGFSREKTLAFDEAGAVMQRFADWLANTHEGQTGQSGRPKFIADNNGFDWQFVNWYFHHFTGANPFGFSSTNLGSLYKGLSRDMFQNFKHLRQTRHSHNALDDAIGNAEALLTMQSEMGLKIKW